MTTFTSSPIAENWSIPSKKGHDSASNSDRIEASTASELNDELGMWTVARLNDYQAELAVAVLSLAKAGSQPWSISSDEPTVALLRLSARMALVQPDVSTSAAAQLLELLRLARQS